MQIKLKICTHPTEHKDLCLALNHIEKKILFFFQKDGVKFKTSLFSEFSAVSIPDVLSHQAEIWSWVGMLMVERLCLSAPVSANNHVQSSSFQGLQWSWNGKFSRVWCECENG